MTEGRSAAIGKTIDAGGIETNYHEAGGGFPVLMLHGSGVGVSGYANWRYTMPEIGRQFRAIAIDMVGFGYSACPADAQYSLDYWVNHVIRFLDAMGIEKTHLLGNSFGGGLALAVTARHPDRVARTVLMGSIGTRFTIPQAFNAGHGYEPAVDRMRTLLKNFTYYPESITDEAVQLRYQTSTRPGYQSTFEKLFPGTREQKMLAMVTPDEQIRAITNEVLLIHGREDYVVPMETSERLFRLIPRSELHLFGQCGHWSHIDHAPRFNNLVLDFYSRQP
jgi:pimeloyl-ACP methyl ester carboxylesterase